MTRVYLSPGGGARGRVSSTLESQTPRMFQRTPLTSAGSLKAYNHNAMRELVKDLPRLLAIKSMALKLFSRSPYARTLPKNAKQG
jgi:hypothetical protein